MGVAPDSSYATLLFIQCYLGKLHITIAEDAERVRRRFGASSPSRREEGGENGEERAALAPFIGRARLQHSVILCCSAISLPNRLVGAAVGVVGIS